MGKSSSKSIRLGVLVVLGIACAGAGVFAWQIHTDDSAVDPYLNNPERLAEDQRILDEYKITSRRDLLARFDLSNLMVEEDDLVHAADGPESFDVIDHPTRTLISEQIDFTSDERLVIVSIEGETVGYPMRILNMHEIVNDTVGEVPIAITYCPLCDSALVIDRRYQYKDPDGTMVAKLADFGVSGFLLNSNVVLYDRNDKSLWSQLMAEAISGPQAGTQLQTFPVNVGTIQSFKDEFAESEIVAFDDTGFQKPYRMNNLATMLFDSDFMWHENPLAGNELRPKTLGLGIIAGEETWFISKGYATEVQTIKTPHGDVLVQSNKAGMVVIDKPVNVIVAQSFYHAWSAFHPETKVLATDSERPSE